MTENVSYVNANIIEKGIRLYLDYPGRIGRYLAEHSNRFDTFSERGIHGMEGALALFTSATLGSCEAGIYANIIANSKLFYEFYLSHEYLSAAPFLALVFIRMGQSLYGLKNTGKE